MTDPLRQVHRAGWQQLDPGTLHDLLKLRIDVFVVEQECPYPELDGRDVEPGTQHWWTSDGAPSAYLRTLAEPGGTTRVGRVCTRADARGQGLAADLMRAVLTDVDTRSGAAVLEAQSYLEKWYGAFGFEVTGAEYVEDGIPHLPMRRGARRVERSAP